jgi:hypothetical protein
VPCQLKPDPTGDFDFLTATGAKVTVFVDSGSGDVHLTAATLDGAALVVNADKTSFTAAVGTNHLNLAFVAADPDEVFRITEDCGGGDSRRLANWRLQASTTQPGGPTRAFRIHAS